jgi:hypothetical protein
VAWLKAKRDCGTLLQGHQEELCKILFLLGFASGSMFGTDMTQKNLEEMMDEFIKRQKGQ